MKKRIAAIVFAIMIVLGLCGCRAMDKPNNGKTEITMYLWDKNMTRELTPWLEEKFPDIDFTFVVSYNSMAYYTDLANRGNDLPDIITCRRFSINDAANLSDKLMDLNQTELAGTFYESYLENNRELDGSIRWLPGCADVDGYVANLDLFNEYNIPIPTNYDEFVRAIDAFEAEGVKGFAADWSADYTCLELMQGCSIPELMSLSGTMWRRTYESETAEQRVGLDEKVWPIVFDKFRKYLDDVKTVPADSENTWTDVSTQFLSGKVAIMRGTANDCTVANSVHGLNTAMLPYFGETSEKNWVLTYPICQFAVSKNVEKDSAKKEAVVAVLKAIFSEEGQRKLALNASVLSYNKIVNINFNDTMKYIADCVENNRMYIRLASTEFFTVSKNVTRKMLDRTYTPKEAYEEFNLQITKPKADPDEEVLITQTDAYPFEFSEHGIPSASSLLNTMLAGTGEEIAVCYSGAVTAPIFEGVYTLQQLKWLMKSKNIAYRCDYTGEEIQRLMEWLINVKEDGSNPVRHFHWLPVTAGMEYTVKDNKDGTYTLENITVNGKALEKDRLYNVLLVGEDLMITDPAYCNCPMPEDLKGKREMESVQSSNSYNCMLESVNACRQLIEPTDYITIE
ncbi:MAG: extracellular solute-binding protein [Oscillospiraceae bacterium]|nr:extracellular solute-binding protein [Oscillospiraceae bacterium]